MNVPKKPIDYIADWKKMNEELKKENNPLSISIPSEEEVKEWIDSPPYYCCETSEQIAEINRNYYDAKKRLHQ